MLLCELDRHFKRNIHQIYVVCAKLGLECGFSTLVHRDYASNTHVRDALSLGQKGLLRDFVGAYVHAPIGSSMLSTPLPPPHRVQKSEKLVQPQPQTEPHHNGSRSLYS